VNSISDSEINHNRDKDTQFERVSGDSAAVALSTLHKRSENSEDGNHAPKRSEFLLGNSGELGAHLEFYGEGTQARAQRELVVKVCEDTLCENEFKVEKYRAHKVHYCRDCANGKRKRTLLFGVALKKEQEREQEKEDRKKNRKRGIIKTFSKASQRRLMNWGNALKLDVKACFVTLTFPDGYYDKLTSQKYVYADLRRFEHRFRRRFPNGAYIWRREQEERKSGIYKGEVFPHFHLLVVGCHPYALAQFVEKHWHDIAGMGDKNHYWVHSVERNQAVQMMRSRAQLVGYLRKGLGRVVSAEMAKQTQIKGKSWGRFWGIAIWKNFVRYLSPIIKENILDSEAVYLIRTFEKIIHVNLMKGIRARENIWKPKRHSYRSLKVGISTDDILRLLTPQGERVYRSTKRDYKKPFFIHAYEMGWLKV